VVVGTGTEIGKTWVTAHVAAHLRSEGVRVAARKPAQSFLPEDVDRAATDAQVLAEATGDEATAVCRAERWYDVPMAPPMAADALGRPRFTIADLVAEQVWPEGIDVGFVETAGGLRSPLADDGDAADLLTALEPDVVLLVADAGLGTINAVRLTVAGVRERGPWPVIVHLNRFAPEDPLHVRNAEWLTDRDGSTVTTAVEALAPALTVTGASLR
jgi:dethiobiotin synthetase